MLCVPPGPIAVASSAMTFTSLSSGATAQYGMIVRNICNSALSLLFTTALFLWGFVVNRKRAWRTDGGTAAFGAGALVLAVSSTAVNFLEVKVSQPARSGASRGRGNSRSTRLRLTAVSLPSYRSTSSHGCSISCGVSSSGRVGWAGGGGSAQGWASERSRYVRHLSISSSWYADSVRCDRSCRT